LKGLIWAKAVIRRPFCWTVTAPAIAAQVSRSAAPSSAPALFALGLT
jgi:hypothetical protein